MPAYLKDYKLKERSDVLVKGRSVGAAIGQGKVHAIVDVNKIHLFQEGEVLVTNKTDPDWEPIMKKASAIVTNQGGRTCYAAIIAREMGIPAIVGCGNATEVLKTGQEVIPIGYKNDTIALGGFWWRVVSFVPKSNPMGITHLNEKSWVRGNRESGIGESLIKSRLSTPYSLLPCVSPEIKGAEGTSLNGTGTEN